MQSQGITILGATGSVGQNTLRVLERHPDLFHVIALSAHGNTALLAGQCLKHNAKYAIVSDPAQAAKLKSDLDALNCTAELLVGPQALVDVVKLDETDMVMAAIVGAAGLQAALQTVESGKRLLLANKESMVIAGALFRKAAEQSGATIIPVDSEHNALFQALPADFGKGLTRVGVRQLILTASGGPFLNRQRDSLKNITPDEACNHPNWDMGRKISVDSATLMNKGLEIIEARWLFNTEPGQIDVIVHPQSIVHSLVSYCDGSVLAQMGVPDMRTPIANALAWPDRIDAGVQHLNLAQVHQLEFYPPDLELFPGLKLAFSVLESGGSAAVVFNAANEVAVDAFLNERIGFLQIPETVATTLERCETGKIDSLEHVLEIDLMARNLTNQIVSTLN